MAEIYPFSRGAGWIDSARQGGALLVLVPAALFVTVLFGLPDQRGDQIGVQSTPGTASPASPVDTLSAHFAKCGGWAGREACVVDGDTIWFRGEKIRLADYNTPETFEAKCEYERDLGNRATARFTQLLNAGPFMLTPNPVRTHDRYGRALFTVTRGGQSLGDVLVAEGLAEVWTGRRQEWC